jgi:hypothetical protein
VSAGARPAATVADPDHGRHLVIEQLRGVDRLVLAGDAAGDAHLDQVGAGPQLQAGESAEAIGTVGLEGVGLPAVPAGAAQRVSGGEDADVEGAPGRIRTCAPASGGRCSIP